MDTSVLEDQLCVDIEYRLEDLPRVMTNKDGERDREREREEKEREEKERERERERICAVGTPW